MKASAGQVQKDDDQDEHDDPDQHVPACGC
jgi:hypothetical protein